jgi:uncharacterized protein YndB with AHSA1/START domain
MRLIPVVIVLAVSLGASAFAEVRETRENAFAVEIVMMVELPPAAAYRASTQVSRWWDPQHTWSGSAKNLSLEPRAGSCFCERLPAGGSVQHGRVIFAKPGELLRLDAALGPLQEMPVTGVLSFQFAPDGPGTRITMNYRVAGGLTMDAARLAPLVDQVMGVQLGRLRDFANAQARR